MQIADRERIVDHELDELKREFLVEAQEKVREMETALGTAETRETLGRVAYLAHQLKGSGGSYGYQSISHDAAEIEQAVESSGENANDPGMREKIHEHVVRLREEIDRRTREL